MRTTTLAVGLATIVAGAVLTAAPAQAATYGVTLTINKSTADIGTKVTLTGKVSGKGSAKKSVVIQRKAGSAWKTITTTTTSSKSTYAKAITIRSTGAGVYRVAAKKAGTTSTGYSPSRTVTGYRWLWLHQQSQFSAGVTYVGTVEQLGKRYPHSMTMFSGGSTLAWGLGKTCDQLSAKLAVADYSGDDVEAQKVEVGGGTGPGTYTVGQPPVTIVGQAQPTSEYLSITRPSNGSSVPVHLLSPKVHCSVDELPDPSL